MPAIQLVIENAKASDFYNWPMQIIMPDGRRSEQFYLVGKEENSYLLILTELERKEYETKVRDFLLELCDTPSIEIVMDEVTYFNAGDQEEKLERCLMRLEMVSTSDKSISLHDKPVPWRHVELRLV